ncbi:MAG: EAL domain-containing protein [Candidatus Omnitrophota bacterium]
MKNRKILLVDDEVDFAKLMAFQLRFKGYDVVIAHTAKEALENAEEKPDLILLDIQLPKMNGYQICARLRGSPKTKNIPIIMLSCRDQTLDKVEGLKLGADDYVTKSAESEELFARIEAILRRRDFFAYAEKEKSSLAIEVKDIIQNKSIDTLFQPILSLPGRKPLGYEIFSRGPKESVLEDPQNLFYVAEKNDMLFELETIVRKQALSKLSEKGKEGLMFFNTNPALVYSGHFQEILDLYEHPENIVLEITERTNIPDFAAFGKMLTTYKKAGFKVSLDDIGSGHASLEAVVELRPDFVKIDKCLIQDIESSGIKQSLVKAISTICKNNSISVIAEGIERQSQEFILAQYGIYGGQGFFLGIPEQA